MKARVADLGSLNTEIKDLHTDIQWMNGSSNAQRTFPQQQEENIPQYNQAIGNPPQNPPQNPQIALERLNTTWGEVTGPIVGSSSLLGTIKNHDGIGDKLDQVAKETTATLGKLPDKAALDKIAWPPSAAPSQTTPPARTYTAPTTTDT